ncbi:MAG: hypothetical protein H8D34_25790 [Chloroflexi bacterium]|nr:hypothetical protein [Chloroflexota bacterium]MBL7163181.1 hypothetical protein [Anaerolineales bacterium]
MDYWCPIILMLWTKSHISNLSQNHQVISIPTPALDRLSSQHNRQRSHALAANLASKLWSVEDVLKLPLMPAPS